MGFCPNCGKQLAEGEACTCTTQAKGNKKVIIGAIAAVAVVVLAVVCILIFANGGGYKQPVTAITKAINSQETNVDKLVAAALPTFAEKSYNKAMKIVKSSDDVKDGLEEAEDQLKDIYESLDDEYGKGWSVQFDYGKGEKVDKDDLEDIADAYSALYDSFFEDIIDEIKDYDKYDYEDMADSLDIKSSQAKDLCKIATEFMGKFEECKVTEAYELTGRIILKDKKGKTVEKTDKVTVRVIKLNGDWTIDYLSLASNSTVLSAVRSINSDLYYILRSLSY